MLRALADQPLRPGVEAIHTVAVGRVALARGHVFGTHEADVEVQAGRSTEATPSAARTPGFIGAHSSSVSRSGPIHPRIAV